MWDVVENGNIKKFTSAILKVLKDPNMFIRKEYIKFFYRKNIDSHFEIYFN